MSEQPPNVIPFPVPLPAGREEAAELAAAVSALVVLPPADRELAMRIAGCYPYRPAR